MRLACSHCERYDAEPLTVVPHSWVDVMPLYEPYPTRENTTVNYLGTCPDCDVWRNTAYVQKPTTEPINPQYALF